MTRTDTARYAHVDSLGIDVLVAEFADHSYERHAHDAYVFLAVERGGIRFRYRGSRVEIGERLLMVLDPEQAHDGKPRDADGFRKSALYVPRSVVVDHLGHGCGERFVRPVFDDVASVEAIARLARRLVSKPADIASDAEFTAIIGAFSAGSGEAAPRRGLMRRRSIAYEPTSRSAGPSPSGSPSCAPSPVRRAFISRDRSASASAYRRTRTSRGCGSSARERSWHAASRLPVSRPQRGSPIKATFLGAFAARTASRRGPIARHERPIPPVCSEVPSQA